LVFRIVDETKVVWMRVPVNGAFALYFGYGKYAEKGKAPSYPQEKLLTVIS